MAAHYGAQVIGKSSASSLDDTFPSMARENLDLEALEDLIDPRLVTNEKAAPRKSVMKSLTIDQ